MTMSGGTVKSCGARAKSVVRNSGTANASDYIARLIDLEVEEESVAEITPRVPAGSESAPPKSRSLT